MTLAVASISSYFYTNHNISFEGGITKVMKPKSRRDHDFGFMTSLDKDHTMYLQIQRQLTRVFQSSLAEMPSYLPI